MQDQHLAVGAGAGADPDRRDGEPPRDHRRDRLGHALEHDREASGRLERERVVVEALGVMPLAPLGLVAAEHRRGLGRQPEVAHHRDPRAHDRRGARDRRPRALELHHIRSGVLHEPAGVPDGILVGHLVRHEGEVADHHRVLAAAAHGAGQDDELVHRRADGRHGVVAEDGVGGRVADEDEVDSGGVDDARGRQVVGGHHHDRRAGDLQLAQMGQRDLHRSSIRMLSMRRVDPNRAAPITSAPGPGSTSRNVSASTTAR